ncbi:MAG: hypothetical protein ACI3XG_04475 [Faecousia sp.]
MKSCFLFGHRDAPFEIQPHIEEAIERFYRQYGIRQFFVGSYGAFDSMAASAVKAAKKRHSDMELYLLLPYHPAQRPIAVPEGFDNTFYPPLEGVPRRYAIVKANQYMVESSDSVICFVSHFGNARNLLECAKKRARKGLLVVENLGELLP